MESILISWYTGEREQWMTTQNASTKLSWKQGLMPRPIDGLSALLYLGVLGVYAYYALSGAHPVEEAYPWLGFVAIFLITPLLIALDRLEYWYHHPELSRQTSIIFRVVRGTLIITLVYLLGVAVYVYVAISDTLPTDYLWLGGTVTLLAVLLLIGIDRLETWYANPKLSWLTPAVLLFLRLILIWVFSFSDNLGFLDHVFIFLATPFCILFIIGRSYGLTGLVWIVYLGARLHIAEHIASGKISFGEREGLAFFLISSLSLTLIFVIAYWIKRERTNRLQAEKLLRELEESHRQLQTYAEQVAELATTEERNRLAREIHDSLGHYMTVINVQLEKAIAFRDRNPVEAEQAVQDSKRLASEALQEIRRSVSALRSTPEPFSLSQALAELVDNMHTGQFSIELDIQGDETGFSRHSLMTLYRAAQEGLTNIQKHAQASQVTVRVRLNSQEADLFIEDNGQGFEPAALNDKAGSYGLQGVRERLELIRGSLKLESVPGEGTSLLITVPKNPLVLVGGQMG
jgi:signal transduction histidine kinase